MTFSSKSRNGRLQCHDWWKNNTRTYDRNWKMATGQGDDYTTGCLLDCPFFKENYKLVVVDLGKQQQALDVDPETIAQIRVTHLGWEILGKMAKNCMKIAKSKILGQKCGGTWGTSEFHL